LPIQQAARFLKIRNPKSAFRNMSKDAKARPERTTPRPLDPQKAVDFFVKFFGSNDSASILP